MIEIIVADMKNKLASSVADYRYEHALRVADTAKELSKSFNMDSKKAYIAGLLHDCAKGFTDDPNEILATAAEAGIMPTEFQLKDPVLFLHAPLSAKIAERDYSVKDSQILNAIARHMSGHINMTKLDMLIYLSDQIEPGRKGMDKYRVIIRSDLDKAFFQLYKDNIVRMVQNGWLLNENVSNVYDSLLLKRRRKAGMKNDNT